MKRYRMVLILAASIGATQTASAQFLMNGPTNYATPTRPSGVAAGDFNGDGFADLAVATDSINKITVFAGDGAGGFVLLGDFPTGGGTGPGHVVAGDFLGGPELDLAIALQNTNAVMIMQGNGAGGFVIAGTFPVGADPRFIAAGHFNGDNLLDLAVANRDSNNVTVLLNGGGTFAGTSFAVGDEPRGVAIGDFNNDTAMDLAVTNHRDRTISILHGNGAGGFVAGGTLAVNPAVRPDGAVAGDFDGDGDDDLAVGAGDPSVASIFMNTGGVLTGPFDYTTGGVGGGSIAAGDLDGDGDLDLAVLHVDSNNMALLPNLGNGTFGPPQMFAVGTTPDHLVIHDLGGSGALDIASTNRDSNTTSVFINQAADPCFADFNGDGTVNTLDVLAFLNAWNSSDASADCNEDGAINTLDVLCFLNLWNAGC